MRDRAYAVYRERYRGRRVLTSSPLIRYNTIGFARGLADMRCDMPYAPYINL